MIVSHDRYFIDKLVDHVFVFEGNGVIKDYPGNYSEYREWKSSVKETETKPEASAEILTNEYVENKKTKKETTNRLSYKEQRELELLEKEIESLEGKKVELEAQLATTTEYEKLDIISKNLKNLNDDLEMKTLRWLEIQEKVV